MSTITEVLERLNDGPSRTTLEEYIGRSWVKPDKINQDWHFEEVDIARIQLVHQLQHDMMVNDEAMELVLHLLDQLYDLHGQMKALKHAINRQPRQVQMELHSLLEEHQE